MQGESDEWYVIRRCRRDDGFADRNSIQTRRDAIDVAMEETAFGFFLFFFHQGFTTRTLTIFRMDRWREQTLLFRAQKDHPMEHLRGVSIP